MKSEGETKSENIYDTSIAESVTKSGTMILTDGNKNFIKFLERIEKGETIVIID